MSPRTRIAIARLAELVVACSLVLVCFLVFLWILGRSFPAGTSLAELVGYRQADARGGPAEIDLDLPAAERQVTREPLIASLSNIFRRVKDKPAGAVVWSDSSAGTGLRHGHAIQTMSGSAATIVFDGHDHVRMSENSLLVVKALDQEVGTRNKRVSLVVLEGEFGGSFSPEGADRMQIEVGGGGATLRMASTTDSPAGFNVQVNADQSATYSVYDGNATVTAGGTAIDVGANFAVTVDASGRLGRLVKLPGRPVLESPANGSRVASRSAPPRVRFEWQAGPDADRHRILLARDPEFGEIVYNAVVDGNSFVHGNLAPGRYYWRVSGRRESGEGPPSEPHRLDLVLDSVPPRLEIELTRDGERDDRVLVSGSTEPGARVWVGDERLGVGESGEFRHSLQLRPGYNVVVVEAVDDAGNVAYASRLVPARFLEGLR